MFRSLLAAAAVLALATPALAQQVTPRAGGTYSIAIGGTAQSALTGPTQGCYITNPLSATDQGIAAAENLYVNPVTTAAIPGNNTTVTIAPGQTWYCVPYSTLPVSVNAATRNHKFSIVRW